MSVQAAIEFIKEQRTKVSQLEGDEQVRTVISRSFNCLIAMLENFSANADPACLRDFKYQFETMPQEREIALKYDNKIQSDPHRLHFYSINECIEKLMGTMLTNMVPTVAMAPQGPEVARQREPSVVVIHEALVRDVERDNLERVIKQEDSGHVVGDAIANDQIMNDENRAAAPRVNNDALDKQMDPPAAQNTPRRVRNNNAPIRYSPQSERSRAYSNTGSAQSVATAATTSRKRGRPPGSRNIVRTEPVAMDTSTPVRGNSNVKTLDCRICGKSGMNISAFVKHLPDVHQTTPMREKIAFLCDCGFVGTNYQAVNTHTQECSCHNLKVVDRAD